MTFTNKASIIIIKPDNHKIYSDSPISFTSIGSPVKKHTKIHERKPKNIQIGVSKKVGSIKFTEIGFNDFWYLVKKNLEKPVKKTKTK